MVPYMFKPPQEPTRERDTSRNTKLFPMKVKNKNFPLVELHVPLDRRVARRCRMCSYQLPNFFYEHVDFFRSYAL